MRYLYKKTFRVAKHNRFENEFLKSCKIDVLRPSPFCLKLKSEKVGFLTRLSRFYFWLITLGKYHIYYLLDGNNIVHSSYLVPKCSKFPFLSKNDYEIGPCVTKEEYRRKGSYSYILEHITTATEYEEACFYMIVKATNIPSIKGIEKSGFKRCGTVKRTGVMKKYKVVQ